MFLCQSSEIKSIDQTRETSRLRNIVCGPDFVMHNCVKRDLSVKDVKIQVVIFVVSSS